jgi:N-acetylgalactosamine-6-sulfatase
MKGQAWEGGIRVPLIARLPGVIPPEHVSDEPAIVMDLFPTILNLAGISAPKGVVLDGKDILPLLTTKAKTPHEALVSTDGRRLLSIRAGNWKLHPRGTPAPDKRPADWVDPRAPDGTTILAPSEQYSPAEFPGVKTGDESTGPALFDLAADSAEQKNVADQHPQVVRRLSVLFSTLDAEASRELLRRAKAPKKQTE